VAAIQIKAFGGIAPRINARYLQDAQAQTALNCTTFAGSLIPLANYGSTVATLTKTGTPLTIYRFGQDSLSDSQYWFHWTTDVNVCRSQIAGDTSEWTFWTDGTLPKATYASAAIAGGDYPTGYRALGLRGPIAAATVTAGSLPTDTNALQETRVYTYTFVQKESGYEIESAPAPASVSIDVYPGQSVTISQFSSVSTTTVGGAFAPYAATHKRIYRSTSGTFLFVAEITIAAGNYVDSIAAEDLAEELTTLTWLTPPDTLKGLINLPGGFMAGFTGRDVYFSDPYHPHAWPVQYMQSLDYPVVGLGRMDTTLAVLTTGVPYFLQGSHPDSISVVKSDLEQACASKRSIVSAGGAVMYASPDGLVLLSPGGSKVITEDRFTRAQWQTLFKPSSIHAYQHDRKYIAFYDNGTVQGGFIYDFVSGEFVVHDIYATAGYNDLVADKLYVAFADKSVKIWLDGTAKSVTWKSKKYGLPHVSGFGAAQLDAEAYPMTLKFYADNTLVYTQTVTSRLPFRLPSVMGRDWDFQIEGSNEVFGLTVAETMAELRNV
jgi:hypothetical protein